MTVLETLTVNLRDLELTSLGGEIETISARTCTAELNIPDYSDGDGFDAADLRERLMKAVEMAHIVGFTSV